MTSTSASGQSEASSSSSQRNELSVLVDSTFTEPHAPRLVDRISPVDEMLVRGACQDVAAAFLETDELDVTSLLSIKLQPYILAQGIVSWLGSDSYDNIVDMLIEQTGPFEDKMSNFIERLQREPLARTRLHAKTDEMRCYGFPHHQL